MKHLHVTPAGVYKRRTARARFPLRRLRPTTGAAQNVCAARDGLPSEVGGGGGHSRSTEQSSLQYTTHVLT
eukprot:7934872-Pyramimonas_sp.AAC.1